MEEKGTSLIPTSEYQSSPSSYVYSVFNQREEELSEFWAYTASFLSPPGSLAGTNHYLEGQKKLQLEAASSGYSTTCYSYYCDPGNCKPQRLAKQNTSQMGAAEQTETRMFFSSSPHTQIYVTVEQHKSLLSLHFCWCILSECCTPRPTRFVLFSYLQITSFQAAQSWCKYCTPKTACLHQNHSPFMWEWAMVSITNSLILSLTLLSDQKILAKETWLHTNKHWVARDVGRKHCN